MFFACEEGNLVVEHERVVVDHIEFGRLRSHMCSLLLDEFLTPILQIWVRSRWFHDCWRKLDWALGCQEALRLFNLLGLRWELVDLQWLLIALQRVLIALIRLISLIQLVLLLLQLSNQALDVLNLDLLHLLLSLLETRLHLVNFGHLAKFLLLVFLF